MVCRFVDDTTALAIFANPAAASEALLRAEGGRFKVRAFWEVRQNSLVISAHCTIIGQNVFLVPAQQF